MQSKNKPAPTAAEHRHIDMIKRMPCIVCGAPGPSHAHEPEQGMWWISMPLCTECHTGSKGWHGNRDRWKNYKMTELKAINQTIEAVMA